MAPLLFLCALTAAFVAPNNALADSDEQETTIEEQTNKEVRSFQKDYFMGILYKKVTDGKTLLDIDGSDYQKRKEINKAILNGTASQKYSLFDRFGSDVSFEMYLGEEQVKTGLADKVYTAVVQDAQDGLSIKDIVDLIVRKDAVYTNTYYEGRPALKADGSDPRVNVYKNLGGITTGSAVVCAAANYFLQTAKVIVSLVSYLASGKYVAQIAQVLTDFVSSDTYQSITSMFQIVFALASITLAFFAVKNLIRYLLHGTSSRVNTVVSLVGCGISLGMILVLTASPQTFINLSQKFLSIGDMLTAEALNDANKDDEIIASDSLDNVVEAALWEDAVFNPWVLGTFGGISYDNLYTTYSAYGDKWNVNSSAAIAYGDISVPRSNNDSDDVKNWAALAYSCSSQFHLNATEDEENANQEFPVASFAGQSRYIFQDDFRWVDAAYKVGQYASDTPNKNLDKYANTRNFNFMGLEQGLSAIWLSILLIPIGILGVKKLKATLQALASFVVFLYRSCVNVILPAREEYNVLKNIKLCFKPILSYFFFTILIIVSISFYKAFGTNSNFLLQLLYMGLVAYMCFLKPESVVALCSPGNAKAFIEDISHTVKLRAEEMRKSLDEASVEKLRNRIKGLPNTSSEINNKEENDTDNEDNTDKNNQSQEEKEKEAKKKPYHDQLNSKKALLDEAYKNIEDLSKRQLKSLKKDYKKIRREEKANKLQDITNTAFNTHGGTIIPPIVKVRIALVLVGLYGIGFLLACLMGAL